MKKEYPKQILINNYFQCPVWTAKVPQFVNSLNKASNKYIKEAQKINKKLISERNKKYGNKQDAGWVHHSTTLLRDKNFAQLENYIKGTSFNLLFEMGFDLKGFEVKTKEMWVQEFSKNGGGSHSLHTHWNGHISGFLFLKCSPETSLPVLEDPRPGALMNGLPQLDAGKITHATTQVHFNVVPGDMIFFPSYMPHQYPVDIGYKPFRFIHWNVQATPKNA
tara:strand:- start:981 stop:1643 length:663 start_codon:yes stop_codon:yes gene_type:complete